MRNVLEVRWTEAEGRSDTPLFQARIGVETFYLAFDLRGEGSCTLTPEPHFDDRATVLDTLRTALAKMTADQDPKKSKALEALDRQIQLEKTPREE